jgi:hypothetical protein
MNMLEIHHAVNANFVWSSGKWPFAPWSIGAGILNVIFTFILCKYIGIAGLVVGTMLAQMMTQNWYVVYYALKRLEISWPAYFKNIVVPIVILILFAGVVTYFTKASLESVIHANWHIRHLAANNFIALFAGPIIVILCTSVVFTAIVLNKAERAIFFEKATIVLNKFKRNSSAKSLS